MRGGPCPKGGTHSWETYVSIPPDARTPALALAHPDTQTLMWWLQVDGVQEWAWCWKCGRTREIDHVRTSLV